MSRIRLLVVALAAVAASLLLAGGASARTHDRNHDRIPDRWERRHHLSLHVDQARRDQDHDGLDDRGEFRAHTNPRDADTDGDGIEDGDEHAGTIASFHGGVLTISLAGGGRLRGAVTDATEIECHGAAMSREDEAGDDRGDEAGDDRGDASGDRGDDRGDDEAEHCGTAALRAGTSVAEARLLRRAATPTFRKVELRP